VRPKKVRRTKVLGLVVLGLAGLGLSSCGSNPLTGGDDGEDLPRLALVRLVAGQTAYQTGETVVVEVRIEKAANVGSVPFRLRYDPDVLRFDPPATEGSFLSADGATTVFLASDPHGEGEVVVGISRLGTAPGAEGAGLLASFEFQARRVGNAGFAFADATVKDPQAQNLPALFDASTVMIE
jgi:hypothetical protein